MSAVVPELPRSSAASPGWPARDILRVRLGALCLLFSGIAELLGVVLRGPLASPGGTPSWFAVVSASPTLHWGWGLLLPSSMLQCFAYLALYRWRRDTPQEHAAFWGMIFSIGSIIVFLPVAGALGFVSQEAAAAQAAGQHGAIALVAATAEGPFARNFLLISVLTGLIAVVLWSRVLWRVSGLGRWVVFFYVFHTVTQSILAPMFPPWGYRMERCGAVALLLGSAAITARIWQDTAALRRSQPT